MRGLYNLVLVLFLVSIVSAEVFFSERFDGDYESRWVESKNKGADAGEWKLNGGIQTAEDYRFYQISSEFEKDISNADDTLVFQFSVRHEQNLDCGGGYLKILPAGIDQENFNGDSPYNIMFGPDICGSATRRVHVIFNYKGENFLINDNIPCKTDTFTHTYTLIVRPDQTYSVKIDNEEVKAGNLVDDWDFLPPKQIKDPSVSKPADWVDERQIKDPEASKPADWDDIPAFIADPEAEIPEDWDEELDGDWEAPQIPNPEYQGEWIHPMIPNPEYKGEWEHPLIDNPDYELDTEIYKFDSNKYVGIEIWQVTAGSIFDNILVTNDVDLASQWAEEANQLRAEEEASHEAAEAERIAEEEAERARLEAELEELDDEEEEEEHGHVHDEL
eukprot:TRINITY_DN107_c4_g1_i1.p1 TRINITY_DN107_c4_g1~~TRINITY_DN107_c4_g1_i1.p1  ORF type:complete len:389 (-),score=217.01 TRINITY_DN107_c4_g1_i1:187-1353(-)